MVVVEKAPYLLPLSAYIHRNPIVIGLTARLEDYPYSSYPMFEGRGARDAGRGAAQPDLKREIQEVVEALSNREPKEQVSYPAYLRSVPAEQFEELGGQLKKQAIVGSEAFVQRVRSQAQALTAQAQAEMTSGHQSPRLKRLVVVQAAAGCLLGMLAIALFTNNMNLSRRIARGMEALEAEWSSRLAQERAWVAKDLDEKHRADLVSFAVMGKRLEMEKLRVRELEAQAR